jgi:tetratricopeptide (TPR) repeat protein
MLNYIIPPIIIVVSLAVLIFFLNKKVPKIQEELAEDQGRKLAGETNNENKKASKIAFFSLHFLEKFGRRSKVFFLKLHNISENATKKIKEKKEKRMQIEEEKKIFPEEQIDNDSNNITAVNPGMQKRSSRAKRAFCEVKEKEIPAKPMISQNVVLPESSEDSKVQYEKILIERIAANPRDIEAYERLGDYYSEQENGKDSLECYKQVLKLSPINRKAKMHIKRLERVLKNEVQE